MGGLPGLVARPALAFSPDGKRFAAAIGSRVIVGKGKGGTAGTGSVLKGTGHPVRALAFSPDGKRIASVGDGPMVLVYSFGWFGPSLRMRFAASELLTGVSYAPDGRRLATAGLDRTVVLWDAARPTADTAVSMTGHADKPRVVTYLDDGTLFSVGESGQAILWDPSAGVKLHEYRLGHGVASAVAASPDGTRVVTGGSDGRVALFNTARATVLTAVGM